jgi:DNA-binding transcriptional LysR family regulator
MMRTSLSFEKVTIHDTILEECRRLGFEPNIVCETSQWNFMIEMVAINQGITILPQSRFNEIDHNNPKLIILPLVEPEKNWDLGIAWRKESYLSFATRTWIQFLKETMER